MNNQNVTINVAALCDKAGRKVNQDKIFLSCQETLRQIDVDNHTELYGEGIVLPHEGMVFVVADGMGGMNAGEIASQLVVETIEREIAALHGEALADIEHASAVARRAVVESDNAIKQYVKQHPETAGTGSTVVLLWLLGEKAIVAWCGDSRCYRYNPCRGLEQLSHDHSYVQQLVNEGKLAPELAFGHDQSNIITRCLSDDTQPAEPDIKVIDVYRDDVFLLCSDGLCGLLPDDVTEQLIMGAEGDVKQALADSWRRGGNEGWTDNVSIIFVSVNGIEKVAPKRVVKSIQQHPSYTTTEVKLEKSTSKRGGEEKEQEKSDSFNNAKRALWLIIVLALFAIAIVLWLRVAKHSDFSKPKSTPVPSVKSTTKHTRKSKEKTTVQLSNNTNETAQFEADTQKEVIDDNSPEEKSLNPINLIQASSINE